MSLNEPYPVCTLPLMRLAKISTVKVEKKKKKQGTHGGNGPHIVLLQDCER